jgi:hypothetical protein
MLSTITQRLRSEPTSSSAAVMTHLPGAIAPGLAQVGEARPFSLVVGMAIEIACGRSSPAEQFATGG